MKESFTFLYMYKAPYVNEKIWCNACRCRPYIFHFKCNHLFGRFVSGTYICFKRIFNSRFWLPYLFGISKLFLWWLTIFFIFCFALLCIFRKRKKKNYLENHGWWSCLQTNWVWILDYKLEVSEQKLDQTCLIGLIGQILH